MDSLRDKKQREYASLVISKKQDGILLISTRFGKCRVGVYIMQNWLSPNVLIAYPDNKIKQAWLDEFEKMDYSNPNITFTSFMSLHKHINKKYDMCIIDEANQLSENNIALLRSLDHHCWTIGLTGSMSAETRKELRIALKWPILAEYTQEEAIKDGVVADYRIHIITVSLDNKKLIQYKKKKKTEKQQFDAYTHIIKKMQAEDKNIMFLALARMRIIQNSISKLQKTKELLEKFKNDRVLVFCGLINTAEQLGIPVQHSRSENNIEDFKNGKGNHLAVCKMGSSGLTYKPLNKIIINSYNSNPEKLQQQLSRATGLEFDNPGKIAEIYIISSNEPVELNWLKKALSIFPKEKIDFKN